ncbi:Fungalysin metallopeptidase-domain-containing protein [Cokeromyces recurvatus]|uniref:Fungalysin metallopeptidase-domain-containing protein n=1 Tax=Cokeromyces recurvatus TaxID=90255 RepID=UPI00221F06CA|nr:Fungalysin metallopeptidase-domain-containing protein [Cokeromyces recurvatus]KAI7897570.1 Fungalysin metallopeptidase-domain-containing protein [Cokeromyces recurvatus]
MKPIFISTAIFLLASTSYGAVINNGHLLARKEYDRGLARSFGPDVPYQEYTNLNYMQRQQDYSAFTLTQDPADIAIAFAEAELVNGEYIVQSVYKSDLNGVTHVYLRQKVNGLEVLNGDININVDRLGRIISYGNSFARGSPKMPRQEESKSIFKHIQNGLQIVSSSFSQVVFQQEEQEDDDIVYNIISPYKRVIDPADAVLSLMAFVKSSLPDPTILNFLTPETFITLSSFKGSHEEDTTVIQFENVPFAESPVEVRQGYIQTETGDLQLVWDVQYELQDNWYNAHVNAHDATLISLVDWVSSASYYNIIPFGFNDPHESLQQLVKNPHDPWASPDGWHTQGFIAKGAKTYNVTIGNNAYTHTNPDGGSEWQNNYRPQGHPNDDGESDGDHGLVFNYEALFDRQEPKEYQDAAVTNLFYWCNIAHDFFYRYGFDEKAGNFQQDNLGRGPESGAGDAVIANAQDGSGRNNANFATPPDGKHGKMRMYVWDQTKPMRDGDFESGIVIHEYTHGVSTRLTGGPKNSNCLGWGEAGGMGEGWGDFIATVIRMRKGYNRSIEFGMGDYSNGGEGIRKYKYSTSKETNPSTYCIMDRFDYWGVHAKGEVWAEMLYEVYWNLVDRLGFTDQWFPPTPTPTAAAKAKAKTADPDKITLTEDEIKMIRKHITSHGNTLAVQLVLDGMKLQPCNPSFISARDAILEAEKQLTGGKYYCDIYRAFAKRGLGPGAKLEKKGWIEQRVESYSLPAECED